jgi:hypothetical protein
VPLIAPALAVLKPTSRLELLVDPAARLAILPLVVAEPVRLPPLALRPSEKPFALAVFWTL